VNCYEAQREISGYLDSEISSGRAAELEGHLGKCSDWRQEAGALQQVKGLIHSLPEVEPPADLQGRATAKMAPTGQGHQVVSHRVACSEVVSLLPAYLEGELEEEQSGLVGDHLERCSSCRKEEAALERTVELVQALPEVAPPPQIRERVAELTRPRVSWLGRAWARTAVASAALASAAVVVLMLRSGPATKPILAPSLISPQPAAVESSALASVPFAQKEQAVQMKRFAPRHIVAILPSGPSALESSALAGSASLSLTQPVAEVGKKEAKFEATDILSAGGRDGYRIVEAGGYSWLDEEPPVYAARPTTPPAPPAEDEKKVARPAHPAFSKLLDSNKAKPLPFAEVRKSLSRKQIDLDKIGPEHARQRPVNVPVIVVDIH